MPPVGFEPTISAGERSQIYALDRAATGTGRDIRIYNRQILRESIAKTLHDSVIKTTAFSSFTLCNWGD